MPPRSTDKPTLITKVSKGAKIKNRCNGPGYQWESDKLTISTTNEGQEVSPFQAGDHKAHINRRTQRHSKRNTENFL